MNRVPLVLGVLTAVGPGLAFAPVFGLRALLLPLAVVAVAVLVAAELAIRLPALLPWRPFVALLLGVLGLVETVLAGTTAAGLPTSATFSQLAAGVTDSWQLTLQSTWPARPVPELVLFVPLAALAAAVLAVELLVRLRRPLLAALPGLVLLALSQAYVALAGLGATLVALAFAVLVATLLAVERTTRRTAVLLVPALVFGVGGAWLGTAFDPVDRPPYSLQQEHPAPVPPQRMESPLDQVADRMVDGERPVFSYTTDDTVDRWRLAVLNTFDGATWTLSGDPRRLGSELPPVADVAVDRHTAEIELAASDAPWLPSQPMPAAVTGVAPIVDQDSGTLMLPGKTGPVRYQLSWWEPTNLAALRYAGIDPHAPGGFGDLGEVPPRIYELANKAVHELRPTFQTALVLERYLAEHYQLATKGTLPTGNGWPQLAEFLLRTKVGTSEQFAAAYVVLARIIGIPARIAVGFRAPAGDSASGSGRVVVRNKHVLAWPEVAVADVGWVALDPMGTETSAGGRTRLAEGTAQARASLPAEEDLVEPDVPDKTDSSATPAGSDSEPPLLPIGLGLLAVAVLVVLAVPVLRAWRAWRRRKRPGAAAVVGAWHEARDRLRAHGVPVTAGMTVRDLAEAVPDPPVVAGLHTLAQHVDTALWSPAGATLSTVDDSWAAVRAVRRGLAARPFAARLRAALNLRSLLPMP